MKQSRQATGGAAVRPASLNVNGTTRASQGAMVPVVNPIARMRPLAPAAFPGEYASGHLGAQPMLKAPRALLYGRIIRGRPFAFAPPALDPKNLVIGLPKPNG